jgi:hypothetical protein
MGSVVDLTLRAAHLPTLIVKKALPEVDQPRYTIDSPIYTHDW